MLDPGRCIGQPSQNPPSKNPSNNDMDRLFHSIQSPNQDPPLSSNRSILCQIQKQLINASSTNPQPKPLIKKTINITATDQPNPIRNNTSVIGSQDDEGLKGQEAGVSVFDVEEGSGARGEGDGVGEGGGEGDIYYIYLKNKLKFSRG